jgi:hypothetical protein
LENISTSLKNTKTMKMLNKNPKNGEWIKPLCPKKCAYGTPRYNPITSASGIHEQIIESSQKCLGTSFGAKALPVATATTVCEIMVGTIISRRYSQF